MPESPSDVDLQSFLDSKIVIDLFNAELKKYSSNEMKRYEYVQRWVFLKEPFSPENDMLTQKMSMKRHNVSRVYCDLIKKVYTGEIGNIVTYD